MEILFRTRYIEIQAQIRDDMPTLLARVSFAFHLKIGKRNFTIEFYIVPGTGYKLFRIKLPFITINNDEMQEVVTSNAGLTRRVVPVTVGKVFGRKIYRIKGVKQS